MKLLTDDLRELAAASGHPRAATTSPFRDTAAPSRALVEHAGELLAATRTATPIYAARRARIAGAAAAIVYILGVIAMMFTDGVMPESELYSLATVTFTAIAYGVVRWTSARRFRRRLETDALRPGSEPLAEARRRIDRLCAAATITVIAAFALAAPVLAYSHFADHYYQYTSRVATSVSVDDVIAIAALGVLAAYVIAHYRDCLRVLAKLPGPILAIGAAIVSLRFLRNLSRAAEEASPVTAVVVFCLVALELVALLVGSWLAFRLQARERARLG